jgi:hypothetical protein
VDITLRVFDRMVLRGMFGVKKEEVAERWKKIRNWWLHNCTLLTMTKKVKKLRKMKRSGNMCGQNTRIV